MPEVGGSERVPVALTAALDRPWLREAIEYGGGRVVDVGEATALVWGSPNHPERLAKLLGANPGIEWIQLPWAGIEAFIHLIDDWRTWTGAQGVYAEPVAELVLTLALTGMRHVAAYARAGRWTDPAGRNLFGSRVTVLGAGGIARALVPLLAPFRCDVTVVRRRADVPFEGARVVGLADLPTILPTTDVLVVALALTPETESVVDAAALDALPPHAWIVNVARGEHVDQDALVAALADGTIGGAALDVTTPEPLPADHPLWTAPNCIITPHVGNTPEMARPLLSRRVAENVRRFAAGEPLLGVVDPAAGY